MAQIEAGNIAFDNEPLDPEDEVYAEMFGLSKDQVDMMIATGGWDDFLESHLPD